MDVSRIDLDSSWIGQDEDPEESNTQPAVLDALGAESLHELGSFSEDDMEFKEFNQLAERIWDSAGTDVGSRRAPVRLVTFAGVPLCITNEESFISVYFKKEDGPRIKSYIEKLPYEEKDESRQQKSFKKMVEE